MSDQTDFNKLPSRIRHYLLEWKDANMEHYCNLHGETKITQMNREELIKLFELASRSDRYGLLWKRL